MVEVIPFESLGAVSLGQEATEVGLSVRLIGKRRIIDNNEEVKKASYLPSYSVLFKDQLVYYIAVTADLEPIHQQFSFKNKTFNEVLEYYRSFGGRVFVEDEVSIISDKLGISAYFEDDLAEISIMTRQYFEVLIGDMKLV